MLQSFHLVPPTRLHCLYDTRLEPTHVRLGNIPVGFIPRVCRRFQVFAGDRTNGALRPYRHLQLSPSSVVKFSRNETPSGVCPLSRWVSRSHQGECARWAPYPSYYRTAFAYPSSSYPHTPSLALRLSYPV